MLVDIENVGRPVATVKGADNSSVKSTGQIGADFRALRRARGWTLSELAEQLDRSVGWLSQVERGVSEPALDDVRIVAALFALPVSFFFSHSPDTPESQYVVRSDSRRAMSDNSKGLVESCCHPIWVVPLKSYIRYSPSGQNARSHSSGLPRKPHVIDGSLTLIIDGREFALNTGDSFRFAGETVSWINQGTKPVVVIWVIAPPVY